MNLVSLEVSRYRSVREETIPIKDLNVFIGPNASGKSTILDTLRFLHEAVQSHNFNGPVNERGGISNLAWKGEHTTEVQLITHFDTGQCEHEWNVQLVRHDFEYLVHETVVETRTGSEPPTVLGAVGGKGWWLSGNDKVELAMPFDTQCALGTACDIGVNIQFAVAERHLEAWYFADSANLREYLGRDLGSVEVLEPDRIENPKLHLKNLLGNWLYTALVSEEIARTLDAGAMQRSASFQRFLAAVRKGGSAVA